MLEDRALPLRLLRGVLLGGLLHDLRGLLVGGRDHGAGVVADDGGVDQAELVLGQAGETGAGEVLGGHHGLDARKRGRRSVRQGDGGREKEQGDQRFHGEIR